MDWGFVLDPGCSLNCSLFIYGVLILMWNWYWICNNGGAYWYLFEQDCFCWNSMW